MDVPDDGGLCNPFSQNCGGSITDDIDVSEEGGISLSSLYPSNNPYFFSGSAGTIGGIAGGTAWYTSSNGSFSSISYDIAGPGIPSASEDKVSPMPDYFSLNGCVALIAVFGICGQIVRDYYNNWYWGVGPGAVSVFAVSLNGGWLLQEGRSEESIQDFTLQHSLFGGWVIPIGNPIIGLGPSVTWGDPSVMRPFDYHDLAIEAQLGNAGGAGGYLYDFWIYDSGDSTPWFFQDHDNVNNINP